VPQVVHGGISKDLILGIIITCLLLAVSVFLPLVSIFSSLLLPLPVLFYRSKLGRGYGIIIPLITVLAISSIIGGIPVGLAYFIGLLVLGFVLSEYLEKDLSLERTVLYTVGTVILTGIVFLIFYNNIYGGDIIASVTKSVTKSYELTLALYESIGIADDKIQTFSNYQESFIYYTVRIIPALIVSLTLFITWISLLFARPILRNRKLFFPEFGALNLWKAPESLVWAVIICGLVLLLPDKIFKVTGLNGLIVLFIIYFFQGVSIISFYLDKKHYPAFHRLLLYVLCLAFIPQLVAVIIISLGFFDTWLDFRKLNVKEAE
jgi:uncharacterized protein YybS (DUF2232 family)